MRCINCRNLGKLKDENGEPYDWCEEVIDCPDTQMERDCRHFVQATRADRIRSMSDEELAEFLAEYRCVHKAPHCMEANCAQCWLDWLRQEAEE